MRLDLSNYDTASTKIVAPLVARPDRGMRVLLASAALALAIFGFMRIAGSRMIDFDVWHQMSFAREVLRTGKFPIQDPFSYTPTVPLIHHEWGSGFISYFLATRFGGLGLLLWKYALGLAIAGLCVACAKLRHARPILLLACAVIQIHLIGFAFATIRAHIYSLLMICALLCFLERDELGYRRWIPFWLFLCVLWVNLHGGIAVGIGLLGVHFVERILAGKPAFHLLMIMGAMILVIAVNPWGWSYYPTIWHALWMPRPGMVEWRPFYPAASLDFALFAWSVLTLIYAALSIGWREMRGLGIVLVTLAGAALHFRMAPFYGLAYCCYVPSFLQETPAGRRFEAFVKQEKLLFTGLSVIVAFVAGTLLIHNHPLTATVPARDNDRGTLYPVGAVEFLSRTGFHGNVFVPFLYGAYVSWKLYPEVHISLDSRYEAVYPEWLVEEHTAFYAARAGWRETLEKYPTDAVLVQRQAPVAGLMNTTGWCQTYGDPDYEIYSKRDCGVVAVHLDTPLAGGQFP